MELENSICTFCRHDLPITHFTNFEKNKITFIFSGRIPIEKGFALLIFRKEGITKNLIHELKYKNNEVIGSFFGNWIGEILADSKEFDTVDCIIPVPIHHKRKKQRGYNQNTAFGKCLSKYLEKPFIEDKLIRTDFTESQTFKSRTDRFKKLETQFSVTDIRFFENKHILLIDDVITTGATIEACVSKLLVAKNIKISIVAMAYAA
ncbi:ComF family protein [Polaribacter sp.]|nr:ComF family protein [Polaribacter sp.]